MTHYIHDCNKCKYIGSFLDPAENCVMDAYLTCKGSRYDFLVRYSDEGPDYITVTEGSLFYKVCNALFNHMMSKP